MHGMSSGGSGGERAHEDDQGRGEGSGKPGPLKERRQRQLSSPDVAKRGCPSSNRSVQCHPDDPDNDGELGARSTRALIAPDMGMLMLWLGAAAMLWLGAAAAAAAPHSG